MKAGVFALVLLTALPACKKRYQAETCDPTTAAQWRTGDDRPKTHGPSPGCLQPKAAVPGVRRGQLTAAGLARTYVVEAAFALPPESPAPLVLLFHGSGGSGARAQARYGMGEAVKGRAVVVYPDGLAHADFGNRTGWDLGADGRDLAFFDQLLETLGTEHCLDLGRVFVTGHSFGGWMTNRLGFLRASRLRAVAPVAGGVSPYNCGGQAVAALIIHGRNDGAVPFAEGEAGDHAWSTAAGCRAETRALAGIPCVAHQGCRADTPVEFCVHSDWHAWPDFASPAIWSFFASLH